MKRFLGMLTRFLFLAGILSVLGTQVFADTLVLGLPKYVQNRKMILDQLDGAKSYIWIVDEAEILNEIGITQLYKNIGFVTVNHLLEEEVRAAIEGKNIDKIVSFSDRAVFLAAQLRLAMKLTGGNTPTVEQAVTCKWETRTKLSEQGLSKYGTKKTSLGNLKEDAKDLPFPYIVKPTNLTASLCVELIHSEEDLDRYIKRCLENKIFRNAKKIFGRESELVVEEYIDGEEYSVDGVVIDDQVHFFGVCEKHTSGQPYFVELGHDFYPNHPMKAEIYAYIENVLNCLGMRTCPFHIEIKNSSRGWEVIEVHSRFAGHMIMELVKNATGIQAFQTYIDNLRSPDGMKTPSLNNNSVFSLRMLAVGAGTVKKLEIDPELLLEKRVVSHHIDFRVGDRVDNILPLNYVAYVIFSSPDSSSALEFHRRVLDCTVSEISQ